MPPNWRGIGIRITGGCKFQVHVDLLHLDDAENVLSPLIGNVGTQPEIQPAEWTVLIRIGVANEQYRCVALRSGIQRKLVRVPALPS